MARLLALDWDHREARVALAQLKGGRLSITALRRVELPPFEAERSPAELGAALAEAIRQLGAGRGRVLVGVARPQIDLRQLTLDAVSDEALADLVRQEWQRETAGPAETILDFVPQPGGEDGRRTVGVATLGAEQLALVEETCRAAGVRPSRILALPHAATGWFLAWGRPAGRTCLLVDRSGEEADLWVVSQRSLVFARTARLPAPDPETEEDADAPLLGEIKRTMVAASNQPGHGPVEIEAIVICGGGGRDRELVQRVAAELKHPVELFDPFTGLSLSAPPAEDLPEARGRWIGTLGLLLAESQRCEGQMDFLHPRRSSRRWDRRQLTLAAVGACVAGVLLGLVAYGWTTLAGLDRQIAGLTAESKQLDQAVKRANEKQAAVAAIEQWTEGEVVWLDELRDLSARFPKRRDGVLQRLTLGKNPAGGGVIELEGLVRDPAIVGRMETTLRDDHHEVRSKRVQESVQGNTHTWRFESSITVVPRTRQQYLASLPPEVSAAAGQAEEAEAARPPLAPPAHRPPPAAPESGP